MKDIKNLYLAGGFALIFIAILLVISWPFILIAALNTLFITLSIPYTFWTWISALILSLTVLRK